MVLFGAKRKRRPERLKAYVAWKRVIIASNVTDRLNHFKEVDELQGLGRSDDGHLENRAAGLR